MEETACTNGIARPHALAVQAGREQRSSRTSQGISSSLGRSKSMPQAISARCCSSRTTSRAQKNTSFRNTTRSAGHIGLARALPLGRPHALSFRSCICAKRTQSLEISSAEIGSIVGQIHFDMLSRNPLPEHASPCASLEGQYEEGRLLVKCTKDALLWREQRTVIVCRGCDLQEGDVADRTADLGVVGQQEASGGRQAAVEPQRLQRPVACLRQKLYPVLVLRPRQAPT